MKNKNLKAVVGLLCSVVALALLSVIVSYVRGGEYQSSSWVASVQNIAQLRTKSPAVKVQEPEKAQETESFSPLGLGVVSEGVRDIQKALNILGFPIAQFGTGSPRNESDVFGQLTAIAVKKFQQKNDLPQTGIVDANTLEVLQSQTFSAVEAELYLAANEAPQEGASCAAGEQQFTVNGYVLCVKILGKDKLQVCFFVEGIKICYRATIVCDESGNCTIDIVDGMILPHIKCDISLSPDGGYNFVCYKRKLICLGDDCWEDLPGGWGYYEFKKCPDNKNAWCFCVNIEYGIPKCTPIVIDDPLLPFLPGYPIHHKPEIFGPPTPNSL